MLLRVLALLSALLCSGLALSAEGTATLQLGVLPNVSARIIVGNYQPLRLLVERDMKRAVEVVTAPDFRTFFTRTQTGSYDIVVTAANFARLAQTEAGYIVLGTFVPSIKGLVVMAKDRPIRVVQELRGNRLAMANPQSLVAMRGLQWLRERGLSPDSDFSIAKAANEDSLGQLILSGEARLAMLSSFEFRQVPEELRNRMEVFAEFAEVPSFVWLAHPRIGAAEIAALRSRLKSLDRVDEGRKFLTAVGAESWREIDEAEMAALDPLLAETRRMLGASKPTVPPTVSPTLSIGQP